MLRALTAVLCLLLCTVCVTNAQAPPPAVARVTDETGTLSRSQKTALSAKLEALEQAKGSQIAVLILPTTAPETIEQYAIRVAEAWKLGREGIDDGVLLVVAMGDRKVRIEVGYGLEGAIPDVLAKRVIEEIMLPRFRDGDLPGGIKAGVDRLIGLVNGEPLPAPPRRAEVDPLDEKFPLLMAFAAVCAALGAAVVAFILKALFGRVPAVALTAGITFAAAWWFIGLLIPTLVMIAISVLMAWMVTASEPAGVTGSGAAGSSAVGDRSNYLRKSGYSHDFGSSSSSSGGGFSGGGGSFGGGGASGSW